MSRFKPIFAQQVKFEPRLYLPIFVVLDASV
jgi:hypothetical protein